MKLEGKGFFSSPFIKYEGIAQHFSLFERTYYDSNGKLKSGCDVDPEHLYRINAFFGRPRYCPPYTIYEYFAYAITYINSILATSAPEFYHYTTVHKEVVFFNLHDGRFFDLLSKRGKHAVEIYMKRYNIADTDMWKLIINRDHGILKEMPNGYSKVVGMEVANQAYSYFYDGQDAQIWRNKTNFTELRQYLDS